MLMASMVETNFEIFLFHLIDESTEFFFLQISFWLFFFVRIAYLALPKKIRSCVSFDC